MDCSTPGFPVFYIQSLLKLMSTESVMPSSNLILCCPFSSCSQSFPLSGCFQFSSVQLLSCVWLFATPWTVAHQACLTISSSQSLLKLMSIELVMPSNHLILCCPPLLPPSIFPSIRVFSNESVLASGVFFPIKIRLVRTGMFALITHVSQDVRTVAVINLKLKQLYDERKTGGRREGDNEGRKEQKKKDGKERENLPSRPRNRIFRWISSPISPSLIISFLLSLPLSNHYPEFVIIISFLFFFFLKLLLLFV